MKVGDWLEDLGLGDFRPVFEENLIDEDALVRLTEADLSELGLPLGPRVKIRAALEYLKSGTSLEAAGRIDGKASAGRVPEGAERRQLTVMFVDLVGSTALQARLDPEDMAQVIRSYQDVCAGVITRFTGHVAKYMGDGVLAYFGWPQAHEDEVAQAVRAGLAIADSVTEIQAPDGTILRARVGLATGLVVVGDLVGEEESQERTVIGETPNLAARLQALAEPDQVVIPEGTRSLLGRRFDLEDLGEFELKGIEGMTKVYAVKGERAVESRFEATNEELMPIVGREHELALIMDRWKRATEGEGQGVLLVGEAGIGKSRTVRAVLDELSSHAHVRIRYQCSPNHVDSALWPVVRQLTFASQIRPDDPPEVRRDKLSSVIVQSVEDAEDARFLGELLGFGEKAGSEAIDPAVQRARTLEALVRQLLILAQGQPALLVLEDAHWSDPTTLELIERTLGSINEARVMVLITSRPDQQPQLDEYPHMSRIPLNRLGRDGIEAIVRQQVHGQEMSPELIEEIITRTDGVPLFAEELTKTVLETGDTHVPATLHDSLMARLDRIGEVKEIAQVASCIGREFDFRLLSEIVDLSDAELEAALAKLVAAGLIFRRGKPPDARYTFKHALLQDTAYESLLKSTRRDTHKRIANALEDQLAEAAEDEPELLAHHLTAAEMPERAIPYWEKAGRRSAERSANTEALGHLGEALEAIRGLPEGHPDKERMELAVYAEMAGPLMSTKGYNGPETVEVFAHIKRLVAELDDQRLAFPSLYQQWLGPIISGQPDRARVIAEEFVNRAKGEDDSALTLMGQRILGISLFETSSYQEALESFDEVKSLYRPEEHESLRFNFGQDPYAAAMSFRATLHAVLGDFARARLDMDDALARAEAVKHANTIGYIHSIGDLTVAWALDDRTYVASAAGKTIELCERFGMALWRAYSRVFKGWSSVLAGHTEDGLEVIASGFNDFTATRTGLHLRQCMAMYAEALHHAKRYEEGLDVVARAFNSTPEETWEEPELYRIKGLLNSAVDRPEQAAEDLEAALDLARRAGAVGMELRVAVSLAELEGHMDRSLDGRGVLRSALAKVVSGLDAPLVQRANELLSSLPDQG